MTKNKGILGAALSLAFAAAACSSSGTTTSTSTGSGGTSTSATAGTGGGGPMAPAASCAQAGDKGNENGVGAFCTPNGGECGDFPKASFCLADAAQDQWMCSKLGCIVDADCGTAAHCHKETAGSACIPDKCEAATTATATSSGSGTGGAGGAGGSK